MYNVTRKKTAKWIFMHCLRWLPLKVCNRMLISWSFNFCSRGTSIRILMNNLPKRRLNYGENSHVDSSFHDFLLSFIAIFENCQLLKMHFFCIRKLPYINNILKWSYLRSISCQNSEFLYGLIDVCARTNATSHIAWNNLNMNINKP